MDKLERKAAALDRAATKAEQVAAKLAAKASRLDDVSARLASLDLWMRAEPGSRKPRFSRDDIAAAALRIADTEGFEALSMRRLATELGSGTMTLYHYVRTKDELLALLHDAVMAELLIPDQELPSDWRRAIMLIADRSRISWQRHPWALDIHIDPAPGPNGAKHFEQSLRAVESYGGTFAERVELITAVDEYVFGYCFFARSNGPAATEYDKDMLAYMNGLLAGGNYPTLRAIRDQFGLPRVLKELGEVMADTGRFHRNLERLLDGFDR
ncbi:TetR/AcrR family transcriptional regulator [Desertimonas flava]|uniref:TetR/AcrR family transcriptional regulator n=1 Tax=Desertimonas flava TaxID=2064846 RepID=UPI0013C423B6|nr:TetR/AcrR family transcriptional regulator [Desertimonas flava]